MEPRMRTETNEEEFELCLATRWCDESDDEEARLTDWLTGAQEKERRVPLREMRAVAAAAAAGRRELMNAIP